MKHTVLASGVSALALALAFSSVSGPVHAQEALPDIDVASATRSKVKLREAPAAVNVVVSEDSEAGRTPGGSSTQRVKTTPLLRIEQHDARRIADALITSPSIFLRGSAWSQTRPGSGQATITMRGIPGRSRVMIDGFTLNSAFSNSINFATINTSDVDRIEVVPGAFSALWGSDAMGGVVNVLTRSPVKREIRAEAGFTAGSPFGYFVNSGFRDKFDNGLGIVLSLSHMGNHGVLQETVTKTVTAGVGGTPVVGATPTLTPDGRPALTIGDKGLAPWIAQNGSLRFYYDHSQDTRFMAGVSYDRQRTYYTANNVNIYALGGSFVSGTAQFGGRDSR